MSRHGSDQQPWKQAVVHLLCGAPHHLNSIARTDACPGQQSCAKERSGIAGSFTSEPASLR